MNIAIIGGAGFIGNRLPRFLGVLIGNIFDPLSFLLRRNLPISSIRVKKFMSNSQFNSSIYKTEFKPPVKLSTRLQKTLDYEFIEDNTDKDVFETELII